VFYLSLRLIIFVAWLQDEKQQLSSHTLLSGQKSAAKMGGCELDGKKTAPATNWLPLAQDMD